MFQCPLPHHNDSQPSFAVYKDTQSWYCFAEHKAGDAVSLIKEMYQCDWREAFKILEGDSDKAPPKLTKKYEVPPEPELDPEIYPFYANYQPHERIVNYCKLRGLTEKSIRHFDLGMRLKGAGRWEHGKYQRHYIVDGKKVNLPACRYLTIPTKRFGEIVHIGMRRDDLCAATLIKNLPDKVQAELLERYGNGSVKEMLDNIWPRFTSESGSKPNIFNSNVLGSLENGKYVAKKLQYVIIVEAQICAMSLMESGYYGIAARPFEFINWEAALKRVNKVFVAQGNDPQGLANTKKFCAILGEKAVEITFPQGCKDMNDVAREGDLYGLLRNYGIESREDLI